MSGREWKAGDVAVHPRYGYRSIFVEGNCDRHGEPHWHNQSGFDDPADSPRRPLVVIDPEDREQVEALAKGFHESDHIAPWHDLHSETRSQIEDALQAALRDLADPKAPKPEEPTGLGAVVVDGDGARFVKMISDQSGWKRGEKVTHEYLAYENIDAVEVLSQGVTP